MHIKSVYSSLKDVLVQLSLLLLIVSVSMVWTVNVKIKSLQFHANTLLHEPRFYSQFHRVLFQGWWKCSLFPFDLLVAALSFYVFLSSALTSQICFSLIHRTLFELHIDWIMLNKSNSDGSKCAWPAFCCWYWARWCCTIRPNHSKVLL